MGVTAASQGIKWIVAMAAQQSSLGMAKAHQDLLEGQSLQESTKSSQLSRGAD